MRFLKGTPEAKAWMAKMRAIRRAGKKREREFFGPRGVFAKAERAKYASNPGVSWHEGAEHTAARHGRDAHTKEEKLMFKGVEVAHRDSKMAARRMKMNPAKGTKGWTYEKPGMYYRDTGSGRYTVTNIEPRLWIAEYFPNTGPSETLGESLTCQGAVQFAKAHRISPSSMSLISPYRKNRVTPSRPVRKNPLAVFGLGNPPQRINTGVAGIVYNICHEIRAEKTGVKKGLYRHPFSRKSGVQILALDNGDLLIHSTRKVRLWKPF